MLWGEVHIALGHPRSSRAPSAPEPSGGSSRVSRDGKRTGAADRASGGRRSWPSRVLAGRPRAALLDGTEVRSHAEGLPRPVSSPKDGACERLGRVPTRGRMGSRICIRCLSTTRSRPHGVKCVQRSLYRRESSGTALRPVHAGRSRKAGRKHDGSTCGNTWRGDARK